MGSDNKNKDALNLVVKCILAKYLDDESISYQKSKGNICTNVCQ